MNFRKLGYCTSILMLLLMTSSFSDKGTAYLTVKVTNIESKKGYIEIGLYSNKDKFLKVGQTYKMVRVKATGSVVTYKFKNIKPGKYAISIYHDRNSDKKCNKNFFGVPTESYCFSNNIVPRFSKPTFSQCGFSLKKARMISIKMLN